jgi:ABC-type dipeptide/oligopeptide/nickel transport system ATPase component
MRAIELHPPDIRSADRHAKAVRVMEAVGLYPAETILSKCPYELSVDPAPGWRFEPRCPFAIDVCRHVTPQLGEVAPSQFAACHVALMQAKTVSADSPGFEP